MQKPPGYRWFFGGERGIRTPGTSRFNGFQDRRNRPLCHLSRRDKSKIFFYHEKPSLEKTSEMLKKKGVQGCFFETYF
jgi:hypothetical protein